MDRPPGRHQGRRSRGRYARNGRAALALTLAITGAALASAGTARAAISPEEARAWKPDVEAAERFARSRSTPVSLAIYDMRNRRSDYTGGRGYIMASTFKVMLLVAYLRQDDVRNRGLSDSEQNLLSPMIRSSDNESATRVRDMLGQGPVERLADAAGMQSFDYNDIWGYCKTAAIDQARFMRRLPGLLPDRHRSYALRLMETIIPKHRWGVADVKPPGWKVRFKGGWGLRGYKVEHQVAFLQHGKRRIGVAVYTQGNPSRKYGRKTLEGVFARLLKDLPR